MSTHTSLFSLLFLSLATSCQEAEKSTDSGSIVQAPQDADSDGFTEDEDCDDTDATINPGATETCDGLDNNCDGNIDEEVLNLYYADSDLDGFGNPNISSEACEAPSGFVENGSDCNDTEAQTYPGAEEICDGLDNNCDESIDEGLAETFYVDEDGDGFGDSNQVIEACLVSIGLSPLGEDCNDQDATIHPLAEEVCDGLDNNCDENIDEDVRFAFYQDSDGDGFGKDEEMLEACEAPEGYTDVGGDCDDLEIYANPFAIEVCDGLDNDCDGNIDEQGASGETTYYTDADQDGYGDDTTAQASCTVPNQAALVGGDCDDTNVYKNPSAFEICDGLDNDCDGSIDNDALNESTWYLDADADGFGDAGVSTVGCAAPSDYVDNDEDCDDSLPLINPDADEICDGVDNDCDGSADNNPIDETVWYPDADADGYGDSSPFEIACNAPNDYVDNNEDCDDSLPLINPGVDEVCDGVDNNCDGDIDIDAVDAQTWFFDSDQDGFGDASSSTNDCNQPSDYVVSDEDCDDSDENINPDAIEVCDGVDNDCDGISSMGTLGSGSSCAAASCQEILDDGYSVGDGLYWLDPDQDGDYSDAWEGYCDMTRDGGGWTKIESAVYPFFFSFSNWEDYGAAEDDNYSKMVELYDFVNGSTYTFRYEVGDSGVWSDRNRSHYTVWTQNHHPAYDSTNGSGYLFLEGEESTTCGGFNGFHHQYRVAAGTGAHSILNDVDTTDNQSCWWMQAIPLRDYNGTGYLEGYNGSNAHVWQAFWVR